ASSPPCATPSAPSTANSAFCPKPAPACKPPPSSPPRRRSRSPPPRDRPGGSSADLIQQAGGGIEHGGRAGDGEGDFEHAVGGELRAGRVRDQRGDAIRIDLGLGGEAEPELIAPALQPEQAELLAAGFQ